MADTWTPKNPTEPGLYWYKATVEADIELVTVKEMHTGGPVCLDIGLWALGQGFSVPMTMVQGWWYGPLKPPGSP